MVEPISSLTAAAIAKLAFEEFVKSGMGELAKRFTAAAIAKMEELRQKIWTKLSGDADVAQALTAAQQGSAEDLQKVEIFLGAAMLKDQEFAQELQAIGQQIIAGKIEDNSSMTQNNYGGTNFQTKVAGGSVQQGTIHNYYGTPPQG